MSFERTVGKRVAGLQFDRASLAPRNDADTLAFVSLMSLQYPRPRRINVDQVMRKEGLRRVRPEALTFRRRRCGKGFIFTDENGDIIRDPAVVARLRSLAVPPAYVNVRYASNDRAHLQAVGEDAAGRLQYRYHPRWENVRELVKAQRLASLARALPRIRRAVQRGLAEDDPGLRHVVSAVIRLVSVTALRAGSDSYARERGTRGATTLLKSNVESEGSILRLRFRAKGAKIVTCQLNDRKLVQALRGMIALPGRRLFQYRDEQGELRHVRAADVNTFLREVSGSRISLKDFRTLLASTSVLTTLAGIEPAESDRARRQQIRKAVVEASVALANTPTVCRASYVHDSVIAAFEDGTLPQIATGGPKSEGAVLALARVVTRHR